MGLKWWEILLFPFVSLFVILATVLVGGAVVGLPTLPLLLVYWGRFVFMPLHVIFVSVLAIAFAVPAFIAGAISLLLAGNNDQDNVFAWFLLGGFVGGIVFYPGLLLAIGILRLVTKLPAPNPLLPALLTALLAVSTGLILAFPPLNRWINQRFLS